MKKVLVILIVLLFIACVVLWVKGPKEKEKTALVPTAVETAEKEAELSIVIQNLVQGDVYNQKSKTTQVHPAKEVKAVKKAKIAKKPTEAEKDKKIEKLKAEITELQKQIWRLLTQEPIRKPEDKKEINWQIRELKTRVAYLESQLYELYEQAQPEPEVVEHHHYYRTWPYFYPYARLCFLSMWPYYPYYVNPFGWYYPRYYDPYYYSSRDYYRPGYSGYYGGRTTISKKQLQKPRTRTSFSTSQLRSSLGTTSSKTLSQSSQVKNYPSRNAGKYASPWGDLRSFSPKRVSKSPSGSSSRLRATGKSLGRQSFSKPPVSKAPSRSYSSSRTSRSTTQSSGKVRRKR